MNIPLRNDEYIYGKNDIYSVVIMLKSMLKESDFRDFVNEVSYELDLLDGKVDSIPQNKILDIMGFKDDWKDIVEL